MDAAYRVDVLPEPPKLEGFTAEPEAAEFEPVETNDKDLLRGKKFNLEAARKMIHKQGSTV
jgi:hypothetical protein